MVRFLASSNWKYCERKVYFHTCNLFVNRIREMVSFKLGKEVEKDLLRLQLSWDWNKEKILGSHGIRFLMGTQNFYLSQAHDKTKNIFLNSLQSLKTYHLYQHQRICLTIKSFFSWWLFPLFAWPYYLIQGWYCVEKWDASYS